ncbi:MAG TPA: glycosyltransferase family 1 protein [Acidimicrobiales bacterium]|nr:glycosyltransferase family 1 protein [Acidimicrobiales bacterium]
MADPAPGGASANLRVAVVAEQLRRRLPGGIGTYATGLLGGLSALSPRPDVTIVAGPLAGRGGHDPLERFPFPLQAVGGPLLAAAGRLPHLEDVPDQIITRLWDRGRLRLDHADRPGRRALVHSVSLAAPPTGATPLTVMVHDVGWRQLPETYPARGLAWHEAALRRAARTARGVAVPSRLVAEQLRQASVELDAERIEVIPEGCDHLAAPDAEAGRRLLARLGVTGEYLLTVGTLEPRKNLRRLLEAYRQVRKGLPEPWPLLVVGPTGWGPELLPGQGVIMVGRVDEAVLSALYAGARLVAYVPMAEGFGLPAVEALAAGAPLLVSSAVPSIVEHASPAVVVDAGETAEIARALGELATDDSRRAELARAGPPSVRERTWEAAARRHLQWWAEVAG